jgi:lysophospholipase L1-like esterase
MAARSPLPLVIPVILAAVSLAQGGPSALNPVCVVLVGDSTVASYANPPKDRPDLTGWGQVFGEFFNNQVTVLNHARSGRSSKSFIREGWWGNALAAKADYIFIQFGHNDCPGKGDRSTDPNSDFQDYLRQYIDQSRAAGARPILVTPVARRTFVAGKIHTILQPYALAMLKVGKEKDVPVIDLHAASVALFNRLGDEGSADLTTSASDRTHFSRKGALAIARLVTEALHNAVPELASYLGCTPPAAQEALPIQGKGDHIASAASPSPVLAPFATSAPAAPPDIPSLPWQERSDWINVRTDVTPAAVGDGQADDTATIQAALDLGRQAKAVYLPPGTYRITKTLVFQGPAVGCLVVGHGRDTRIVWDGPQGGCMFRSNGVAYSRYAGLSWDGRGKAAVGFDHASEKRFETEVRHEHEAFRNFVEYGIRVGHEQRIASAEILYRNCLFENCGTALAVLAFNDYDNTIDGCEFRHCGTGVLDHKGNFCARNCHFENGRQADFAVGSEHGSSIRRCTSVGSRRFIEELGTIAPLTIQDCHVAGWTDPEGAVHLNGSPVLLFDCSFSRSPSDRPPVKLGNAAQKLLLSNNQPATTESLVQATPAAKLYLIPPGRLGGVVGSAEQRFLRDSVPLPGKVFDAVTDFDAKGDGKNDDTAAIQATIDAARQAGSGAIAYLPTGRYVASKTLSLVGRDYMLGGSGFRCGLVWRGEAGQPLVEVDGVQNVTLADLAVGNHDFGPMNHGDDLRVTSASGSPCRLTLDEVYGFGMYQKAPDTHGLHFDRLPPGSVVDAIHVEGNLRITGSDRAALLFRTSYEGTVTIEGPAVSREGIVGFLTRLATQSKPTLRVRDNRSVVMSDFYNEQSD